MQSALALDIDKVIPGHRDLDMIRVFLSGEGFMARCLVTRDTASLGRVLCLPHCHVLHTLINPYCSIIHGLCLY